MPSELRGFRTACHDMAAVLVAAVLAVAVPTAARAQPAE